MVCNTIFLLVLICVQELWKCVGGEFLLAFLLWSDCAVDSFCAKDNTEYYRGGKGIVVVFEIFPEFLFWIWGAEYWK